MQFGDTAAYKKYEGSILPHTDTLPYRHLNSIHVHEPSKVPPSNGPTLMQAHHGAPHQVRPSHNPATVSRVMPPLLSAHRSSSIGPHENISAAHNSIRSLPPRPAYSRSAVDTFIDPNKPSVFVPSASASTFPVPVTVAGHIPAQKPITIMHTQGIMTPPVTGGLEPPMAGLPQLLQPQLHAGAVGAPLPGSISMMLPPPPGPHPSSSSQAGLTSLPTGPAQLPGAAPAAVTGLLSTLMAQGLITLKPQQTPSQVLLTREYFIYSEYVYHCCNKQPPTSISQLIKRNRLVKRHVL
jgi:hypothetical protein